MKNLTTPVTGAASRTSAGSAHAPGVSVPARESFGLNQLAILRDAAGRLTACPIIPARCIPVSPPPPWGAEVLEVHVTMSRRSAPDVPASVTLEEMRQLVEGVRFIEKMNDHPVDKMRWPTSLRANAWPVHEKYRGALSRPTRRPGAARSIYFKSWHRHGGDTWLKL